MKSLLVLFLALISIKTGLATLPPKGYTIPEETLSPSGQYGFTAPFLTNESRNIFNSLVSLKTKKIITKVFARPGFDHPINHIKIVSPRWSKDETLVLWKVDGKWAPLSLVLIRFNETQAVWQRDLLTLFQKKILAYTKIAAPKKYEKAKQWNRGCGSAYPDGFTIDVEESSTSFKNQFIDLPLTIHVTLTSDPKKIENSPRLESEMDGIVDQNGEVKILNFHLI
ncbi:MAG: hypothetical protein FJ390_00875 [Verrucomicrobia bacterium]|nr:hypothetical protein [Verrucomicrobiota bacterium]